MDKQLTPEQIRSALSEPCEVDPLGIFGEYYLIAKKSFTDFSEAHNKIIMDALYALALARLALKAAEEKSEARRVMLEKHQFSNWQQTKGPFKIPYCSECGNSMPDGHKPDCALAALAKGE
jgi:hypothetical protein